MGVQGRKLKKNDCSREWCIEEEEVKRGHIGKWRKWREAERERKWDMLREKVIVHSDCCYCVHSNV